MDAQNEARSDTIFVSANYVRAILSQLASVLDEQPPDLALRHLVQTLADSDALEVQLPVFLELVAMLDRVVGKHWPLEAASAWRSPMHGLLDTAVQSSKKIDDALDVLMRFGRVRAPFGHFRERRTRSGYALIVVPDHAMLPALWDTMSMIIALSGAALLESLLGERGRAVVLNFPWQRPGFASQLEASFQGRIIYGAPECSFVVPDDLLKLPSPFADPRVNATASAYLESATKGSKGGATFVESVRKLIDACQKERPNAETMSRQLGMSRSTFTRRLKANGHSFRILCDEQRKAHADKLYLKGLDRYSIAETLGYADPTSLSRARRRWLQR
jgi:AraC-like DNA-binding protein